ncbi:MAG: hypothetical protein BroJett014_25050 [Planctomycetota bacterium]|nr:MAG: hypothetical protein BroJett014_25050 [Planctomycetota bacterium]
MTIGTALIGLAMLVFAGIVVTQPLQSRSRRPRLDATVSSGRDYEAMLLALRDLELDHELGVVEAAEYAQLRTQLMSQAAQALQQTEQTQRRLDAAIETAVRVRRQQRNPTTGCPDCRQPVAVDDKFCAACGIPLLSETKTGNG